MNSDAAALETWYAFLRPVQPPMFQCQLPSKPTDAAVRKAFAKCTIRAAYILRLDPNPLQYSICCLLHLAPKPCCDPLHTTLR